MNLYKKSRKVNKQRSKQYGSAKENFTKIARMWSVILNTEVTAHQAALCMLSLKVVRESSEHKEDNIIDLHGYADIVNECK